MKTKTILTVIALAATFAWQAQAQNYDTNNVVVQTFAGSGFAGYVDGVGQQTMFNNPLAIVSDSASNLFVLDVGNFCIRKITPDGSVSTFAGRGGVQPPGNGTNVTLGLTYNSSMAIDHSDALWILVEDNANNLHLLRIRSDGYVTKTNIGWLADNGPNGICVDSQDNVYYSTSANKIFRYRIDSGIEVFAGSGNSGSADGNGIFTSFNRPTALAIDAADNIYIWDSENHLIRRINQNRDVVTIAGKVGITWDADGSGAGATFGPVAAMTVDNSGNLILACSLFSNSGRASIRKMTAASNVVTLAGSFTQSGYTNGTGNLARFMWPSGVCVSQGMISVADTGNQQIRNITLNPSPQPVLPANLQLSTFAGLQIIGTVGRVSG
jgi:hypothetical protein